MKRLALVLGVIAMMIGSAHADSVPSLPNLLSALQQGGHVIVLRHGATDAAQQDVYPFDFADMSKQRQLSDKGRETARAIGSVLRTSAIPLGVIYTSELNRAVETGRLMAGKDVKPVDFLTDSSAGNAAAMASTTGGGNAALGAALRKLATTAPTDKTNTLVVTHKTNIIDAFGKDWGDVQEGEATIFRPDTSGNLVVVARIPAAAWSQR